MKRLILSKYCHTLAVISDFFSSVRLTQVQPLSEYEIELSNVNGYFEDNSILLFECWVSETTDRTNFRSVVSQRLHNHIFTGCILFIVLFFFEIMYQTQCFRFINSRSILWNLINIFFCRFDKLKQR